jgi:hypothetical protein
MFFRGHTHEDLLVLKIMTEIKTMLNKCPFKYLLFPIVLEVEGQNKPYNYIIKEGKLYLDTTNAINNKDLNLFKYCFYFNGKPKTFKDLENYEFFSENLGPIKKSFEDSLAVKKELYRIQ